MGVFEVFWEALEESRGFVGCYWHGYCTEIFADLETLAFFLLWE